ncbi:hypothetical protein SERLA73DRAFT_76855 [Serpula lacrymans var. lacrymans S7.3]|uniref:DUF6533 domain-containing protein n=1 Tax=Serpula lacrymans var. lacrymans (strain S7.3) TaxID=936435 RepID=F8Q8B2_SERL3|nr:hypothetical protein SERLA73DRAFT_76855 [Serpula lacrymans var. lacrymans S7.3]
MLVAVPQSFANDLIIRRVFSVVGYTILVWDFILTLSREIHYIWAPKMSTVNLVFLANRYANLICQTVIIMQELAIIRAPSHQGGRGHLCLYSCAILVVFLGHKHYPRLECFSSHHEKLEVLFRKPPGKISNAFASLTLSRRTVFSDGPINNIPVTFTVPLLNIAGQRLVLNLRSTMAHSQRHAMDTTRLDQEVSRQIRAFVGVESDPMLSGHECNCALGCECVCDDQDVALPTSSSCCEHQLAERVERQRLGDVELTEVADSEDVDSYYARNS